jgi:proline racemase
MANPYTPRHITDANIIVGTSAQPQIEKMVEQIRLLSKVVIKLRRQLTVHPQPAQDVPTHILPP